VDTSGDALDEIALRRARRIVELAQAGSISSRSTTASNVTTGAWPPPTLASLRTAFAPDLPGTARMIEVAPHQSPGRRVKAVTEAAERQLGVVRGA